MLRQK
jgi:hypothetical protein